MTEARTADDVWRLLGELLQPQKETEHRLQETERLLKEQTQETERLLKEQARQLNQQTGKLGALVNLWSGRFAQRCCGSFESGALQCRSFMAM